MARLTRREPFDPKRHWQENTAAAAARRIAKERAWAELAAWPRCNDGTYLKIPRPAEHEQGHR